MDIRLLQYVAEGSCDTIIMDRCPPILNIFLFFHKLVDVL
jgi:hypothetical protein